MLVRLVGTLGRRQATDCSCDILVKHARTANGLPQSGYLLRDVHWQPRRLDESIANQSLVLKVEGLAGCPDRPCLQQVQAQKAVS